MCQGGLDGVVLDTEHSSFNDETLFSCIQVITLSKKKCFVRLTDIDKKSIRRCLDSGVDGLIFSTVETVEQAILIQEYSKYPSQGGRRGIGLVRQNKWGNKKLIGDDLPILVAQIETKKAIDDIEYLTKMDIFDYFLIGPYDLSTSLGTPGIFFNERYLSAIHKFSTFVESSKRAVHIPKDVEKEIKK